MRFCYKCNDKRICHKCSNQVNGKQEFEVNLNLLKTQASNQFGFILP